MAKSRVIINAEQQQRLRLQIFTHYGMACVCCGENTIEFLCLDHINGGGVEERKRYGNGRNLWLELRRRDYPSGYQTLCANCNQARKYGKTCPHRKLVSTPKALAES